MDAMGGMLHELRAEIARVTGRVARYRCWSVCAVTKGDSTGAAHVTTIDQCCHPMWHDGEHNYTPTDLREFMAKHTPDMLAYVDELHERAQEHERLLIRNIHREAYANPRLPPIVDGYDIPVTLDWAGYDPADDSLFPMGEPLKPEDLTEKVAREAWAMLGRASSRPSGLADAAARLRESCGQTVSDEEAVEGWVEEVAGEWCPTLTEEAGAPPEARPECIKLGALTGRGEYGAAKALADCLDVERRRNEMERLSKPIGLFDEAIRSGLIIGRRGGKMAFRQARIEVTADTSGAVRSLEKASAGIEAVGTAVAIRDMLRRRGLRALGFELAGGRPC